jgi:hypothetical protein
MKGFYGKRVGRLRRRKVKKGEGQKEKGKNEMVKRKTKSTFKFRRNETFHSHGFQSMERMKVSINKIQIPSSVGTNHFIAMDFNPWKERIIL